MIAKYIQFTLCGMSWVLVLDVNSVIFIGGAVVLTLGSLDLIVNRNK